MCMTFRNGCEKRISRTGYVMIGFDETHLYFVQALNDETGFKFTGGDSNKNRYLKVANTDLIKFVGDYPLLKDAKSGMYYIQKGE